MRPWNASQWAAGWLTMPRCCKWHWWLCNMTMAVQRIRCHSHADWEEGGWLSCISMAFSSNESNTSSGNPHQCIQNDNHQSTTQPNDNWPKSNDGMLLVSRARIHSLKPDFSFFLSFFVHSFQVWITDYFGSFFSFRFFFRFVFCWLSIRSWFVLSSSRVILFIFDFIWTRDSTCIWYAFTNTLDPPVNSSSPPLPLPPSTLHPNAFKQLQWRRRRRWRWRPRCRRRDKNDEGDYDDVSQHSKWLKGSCKMLSWSSLLLLLFFSLDACLRRARDNDRSFWYLVVD